MSVPRQVFETAFAEGGSVLIHSRNGGMPITNPADMPSEFEMAEGDAGRQAAILATLEADLAAQQARIEAIKQQMEQEKASSAGMGQEVAVHAPKQPSPMPATGHQAEQAAQSPSAELRTKLEAMTIAELTAEAEAAQIAIPSDVTKKADIIAFLLKAQAGE